MNCNKCGALLASTDKFCKKCGAAVGGQGVNLNQAVQNNNVGGQPVNNFQQPVNPNYNMPNQGMNNVPNNWSNNQPNYNMNGGNKSNNTTAIILGVVALVVVLGLVIGGVMAFSNKSNNNDNLTGNNTGNIVDNNNSGGNSQPVANSTYKINFSGFDFKIPNNIVAQADGNQLMFYDESETWVGMLEIIPGAFSELKAAKDQLPLVLQQQGLSATSANIKTINGIEYIIANLSMGSTNAIAAFAQLNYSNVATLVVVNQNNDFNEVALQKMAPVISSAKYVGISNNAEISIDVDMNKIIEGLKK